MEVTMKPTCHLYQIAVAALLLFSPPSFAQQKLSVVTLNWEPFYGESLPRQGVVTEIVRHAFAAQGVDTSYRFIPWERALESARVGQDDVLMGVWYSEQRNSIFNFSDPFLNNRVVFIKRTGDDFEYRGLESLGDRRIGVVRGYAYSDAFNDSRKIRKFSTSSLKANLQKLVANRIDLTLGDELVVKNELNLNLPELKDKLELTSNALEEKSLYIVVSLQHPRHQQIIEQFNLGLQAIKRNDSYQSILHKHGFN
jgi:polar amino acid transport system substrate-binding protein